MKFGGTSVKDAERMRRVVSLALKERADGHEVAIVSSAVTGVTNGLVKMVTPPPQEGQVDGHVRGLQDLHLVIARDLFAEGTPAYRAAEEALLHHLGRLRKVLQGIVYTEELTPRTRDLVLSFGERLSCTLLHHAFEAQRGNSVLLESDQIGMMTDGRFGQASPLLPQIEKNFQRTVVPHLEAGKVPVITGFFGQDAQLHAVTFGRGGSDYAAAIVAYAIDADACEIWTDVDGFMTCDPRLIPEAELIAETSYEAAAELAYFGAKVLHARTVEPVELKGIPIQIKNTYRPEAPGTWIVEEAKETGRVMSAIAYKDRLASLRLYGPGLSFAPETFARIVETIAGLNISLYAISTSASNVVLLVDLDEVGRAEAALESMRADAIDRLYRNDHLALICCVGEKMARTPGIAARVFGVIGREGVNLELIAEGGSPVAVNFAVRQDALVTAVRVLHKEFFGPPEAR
ncbi:MAG: aspartate kinase [Candidatus Rokuibacteriota bacterium]